MDWLTQEGFTEGGLSRGVASNLPWSDEVPGSCKAALPGSSEASRQEERLACLARTIEAEIIPRLMLAHRALPLESMARDRKDGDAALDEVAEFTVLILKSEYFDATSYVSRLRGRGVSLEEIYLTLIGPTARRLGEMWESDLCDFTQVTVGLWRLQHLLLDLSEAFQDGVAESVQGRRALLVAGPGEQHTLGLFMVAEFLRRAGWEVSGAAPSSRAGLIDAVRAERFDIAGLSAGCDCHLDRMAATIADIRRSSRNTEIAILVGGSAFANHPEAVARVGADAMAQDAREAVKVANRLVCVKERR